MDKDVIARLAAACASEKQAAIPYGQGMRSAWNAARGALGHVFGRASQPAMMHGAAPIGQQAAQQATRQGGGLLRTARNTLGTAAGIGGLGYAGHEAAQYDPQTHAYNPFSWGLTDRGREWENVYHRNNQQFNDLAQPTVNSLNEALAGGDLNAAQRHQGTLASGNFGPWYSMGGLNPLARRGSDYQRNALASQHGLQGEYNQAMARSNYQSGDGELMGTLQRQLESGEVLPIQRTAMQRQLDVLRQRMSTPAGTESPDALAIAQRMRQSGMHLTPASQANRTPTPASPYYRPMARTPDHLVNYSALNLNDFSPHSPPPNPWERVLGQGGTLTRG
jgi:hypothetical protein